jgi:hypothetical protein
MSNRRKRLCLAVVLLLVVLVCVVQSKTRNIDPFFIQLSTDGKCEIIRLWEQETGEYYVFLPSYADFPEAEIRLNTTVPIYVDGEILTEGMDCEIFQSDVVYDVTYTAWGKEYNHTIVFMKSANVATMYIDTESGSMEYIHDKKGNEEEIDKEKFEKAKENAVEDGKEGDERTDNDDDLEDDDEEKDDSGNVTKESTKDPRKIYKRRTYKRGNKTFKSKSYYNKKGKSITAKEFNEKVANFENKNKTKDESFSITDYLRDKLIVERFYPNDITQFLKDNL